MPSVWVIEDGSYSDYHVVGVFSTREKAEQVLADYGHGEIAEWPLDPGVDDLNAGLCVFQVKMLLDGTTEEITRLSVINDPQPAHIVKRSKFGHMPQFPGYNGPDFVAAIVVATDEQHAVKIVNEARIRLIMEPLVHG